MHANNVFDQKETLPLSCVWILDGYFFVADTLKYGKDIGMKERKEKRQESDGYLHCQRNIPHMFCVFFLILSNSNQRSYFKSKVVYLGIINANCGKGFNLEMSDNKEAFLWLSVCNCHQKTLSANQNKAIKTVKCKLVCLLAQVLLDESAVRECKIWV